MGGESGDVDEKDFVVLADNGRAVLGGEEGALIEGLGSSGLAEPVRKRREVALSTMFRLFPPPFCGGANKRPATQPTTSLAAPQAAPVLASAR